MLAPPPTSSTWQTQDSLLENTLLKDLFLRHNVQVGKRCIQEVQVCIFIDSPEGENTPSEPEKITQWKREFT